MLLMANPFFLTGIGTGIGKTVLAAICTEALGAAYWKPIQAGYADGTDTEWIKQHVTNPAIVFHPELYKLKMPASAHIAAREEGINITVAAIAAAMPVSDQPLVIEGAGGLLVPLNDREFVADLPLAMDAGVILVSRNYLGSINHSLLTAAACKARGLRVLGWLFNDQFGDYEQDIVLYSGLPSLGSVPFAANCDRSFILQQASRLRSVLKGLL
jgi:dethiobiotin synthetase